MKPGFQPFKKSRKERGHQRLRPSGSSGSDANAKSKGSGRALAKNGLVNGGFKGFSQHKWWFNRIYWDLMVISGDLANKKVIFHGFSACKNDDFMGVKWEQIVISREWTNKKVWFHISWDSLRSYLFFFPGHWRLSDSGSFQFQLILRGYPNDEKHPVLYHHRNELWTLDPLSCVFLVELEEPMTLASHLDAAFILFPLS